LKIFLPTGTKIETIQNGPLSQGNAENWAKFMNVKIYPGLVDIAKTSGLCGNFDGKKDNDGSIVTGQLSEEYVKRHRYFGTTLLLTERKTNHIFLA